MLSDISIRQANEINCMHPKDNFFQLTAVSQKVGIKLIQCTNPNRSRMHGKKPDLLIFSDLFSAFFG